MSAPLTVAQTQRRFVLLTFLRWLPVGLVVPVTVLLASARGLSAAEIGLVLSAHGAVVIALELPTGGLADALGRRPVLLLSGGCNLAGLLLLALAQGMPGFALAYAVIGVGRALDSGPLEAWFVDAVHAADPRADTTPGLARAGAADGLSLALGALLGGGLPLVLDSGSDRALAAPFLVAAALTGVQLVAVVLLVVPVGAPRPDVGPLASVRQGVRDVPRVVRDAVRLARGDRALRLLLLLSAGTGGALVCIELLAPLRFAALTGGEAEGGASYSLVVAAGFLASAVGSTCCGRVRRALGTTGRATALLSVLGAAAMLALGLGATVWLLALGGLLFYAVNGAAFPLRRQLLHTRVGAAQRATVVSVSSLALQLGGLVAMQGQARLYDAAGAGWAFGSAAALMLVLAAVSLLLPEGGDPGEAEGASATSPAAALEGPAAAASAEPAAAPRA